MMPAQNTISVISTDPTCPQVASWHFSPHMQSLSALILLTCIWQLTP